MLAALWLLAGCADNDRLSYTSETDDPDFQRGRALKDPRRQEALSAFLKVIERRGDDAPESHLEAGLLYHTHINDPLSALYHFKKYLALRPNSPQAPLVRQRADAAVRDFARTLPAQPLDNQLERVELIAAMDRLKKENDLINFGTNFWAAPLAVVRGGFRASYGFGFLLDRNFGNDVFGAPPTNRFDQ